MNKLILAFISIMMFAAIALAQPRPMDRSTPDSVKPAPESFEAKYQGGFFGHSDKIDGKLKFDDANSRLVFFNEEGKELFGLPYDGLLTVYPQSQSVTSTTGNVVRNIPLPGAILGGFIKEKRRYLVIRFDDPEMDTIGTMSFKVDNKEILDSVVAALGEKGGLHRRGDAYFKPKKPAENTPDD
jgi:hypothetical protein